mmetsp:Transcript_58626/g.143364  ORF Transcript_58626/g.143364 Transcript_58626/m.143364 type:complete len:141 (+) Transcript_58626:531-953(+)
MMRTPQRMMNCSNNSINSKYEEGRKERNVFPIFYQKLIRFVYPRCHLGLYLARAFLLWGELGPNTEVFFLRCSPKTRLKTTTVKTNPDPIKAKAKILIPKTLLSVVSLSLHLSTFKSVGAPPAPTIPEADRRERNVTTAQ